MNDRFTKYIISEAIEIVLIINTFNFDGKHYEHIKGTAMGSKMAPAYATQEKIPIWLFHHLEENYMTLETFYIILKELDLQWMKVYKVFHF